MTPTIRRLSLAAAVAAGLSALAFSAIAQGGSGAGDYPGDTSDPVSGYPCVTPFCDTVSLPGTSCLCQKVNPNETRRAELRFVCTDMRTRAQCSAQPK